MLLWTMYSNCTRALHKCLNRVDRARMIVLIMRRFNRKEAWFLDGAGAGHVLLESLERLLVWRDPGFDACIRSGLCDGEGFSDHCDLSDRSLELLCVRSSRPRFLPQGRLTLPEGPRSVAPVARMVAWLQHGFCVQCGPSKVRIVSLLVYGVFHVFII